MAKKPKYILMKTSNKLLLLLLILILSAIGILIGIARNYTRNSFIPPSGEIIIDKRPVEAFSRLHVQGKIKVILTTNSAETLELKGDKNFLKSIRTTFRDGDLYIKAVFKTNSDQVTTVLLNTASIETLDFSAGSSLECSDTIVSKKLNMIFNGGSQVKMKIKCEEALLSCSSGVIIELKGSADYFRIYSSHGSLIDASNLIARKGSLEGTNGSVMSVNITQEIEGTISNGAVVNNLGNPLINNVEVKTGATFNKK